MNIDELFIDSNKLPDVLSDEEICELFNKVKAGDQIAREKIMKHNIKLVLFIVTNKFNTPWSEKKELVSVGVIGLLNAVDTFNISKSKFSTYASKCINNEINMFLRKKIRRQNIESIDNLFNDKNGDKKLKIEDIIGDDTDIVSNYIKNETYEFIRNFIETLPDRDKKIIIMSFGFYDGKIYSQREIGNKLNLSQPYVSRLLKNILKKFRNQLQINGFVEINENKINKKNNLKNFKTIYEFFYDYSKEQINEVLLMLNKEELELIKLRFGKYFDEPINEFCLPDYDYNRFYNVLIPKIKKMLANLNNKLKNNLDEYYYNKDSLLHNGYVKKIKK